MTVIRRAPERIYVLIGANGLPAQSRPTHPSIRRYPNEQEYVRADQLAGAVTVLRDLVNALDNVCNSGDAGEPLDRAETFLREHGG